MSDIKIHEKLDKLDERLDSIDIRLEKYNSELEFHVARTNQIEDMLVPVVKAHEQIKGAGKLLMWLSIVATIITGVSWLWAR